MENGTLMKGPTSYPRCLSTKDAADKSVPWDFIHTSICLLTTFFGKDIDRGFFRIDLLPLWGFTVNKKESLSLTILMKASLDKGIDLL